MQHVMQGANSSFTASSNADPDDDRVNDTPGETHPTASSPADPSATGGSVRRTPFNASDRDTERARAIFLTVPWCFHELGSCTPLPKETERDSIPAGLCQTEFCTGRVFRKTSR